MKDWRLLDSRLSFLLFAAFLTLQGPAQTAAKPTKPPDRPTWVELGENGTIIARQVREYKKNEAKPKCPSVHISKEKSIAMTERGGLPKSFGNVVVCETEIPSGTTSAWIGKNPKIQLRLPNSAISRVILIGDTGCKGDASGKGKKVEPIEEADEQEEAEEAAPANAAAGKKPKPAPTPKQDCTTTEGKTGWPFSKVSKYAAGEKPDLVIHVGDYVYIKGDNWENWDTQFFQPAHDLLLSAPWIFVRGNHENCSLHGNGFLYLLDPRAPSACPDPPQPVSSCPKDLIGDSTNPYLVKVGGSQFVVMDSSGANCDLADKECAANPPGACFKYELNRWKDLFSQANHLLGSGSAFLLTHRPLWGMKSGTSATPPPAPVCPGTKGDTAVAINATLQAGYEQSGMKGINMVLSGHIHNFQLVTYKQASGISPQPQLVVGDSGVVLSTPPPQDSTACNVIAQNGYLERSSFQSWKEYGFGVLKDGGSKFDLYTKNGDLGLKCNIGPNTASCKKEKKKKSAAATGAGAGTKQK